MSLNETNIWKTLTLSSLARSAAKMEVTFEQGPPQALAQEFSTVVNKLMEEFATEGDVHSMALIKCSKLADELKRYNEGFLADAWMSELASV